MHPDRDHIAGIIPILESDLKVQTIFMNRPWRDSKFTKDFFKDRRITPHSLIERIKDSFLLAEQVEELAQKKHIKIDKCFAEDDERRLFEILSPSQPFYKSKLLSSDKAPESIYNENNTPYMRKELEDEEYDYHDTIQWFDEETTSDVNETSLVIALHIGKLHFLLTGDAGKRTLSNALTQYEVIHGKNSLSEITHVLLPHHGSRKNMDPDILNRLGNTEFIISCPPDGEKEGHPSRRLINKILELKPKAEIYRTGNSNFNIHKGVKITCTAQKLATASPKMDGKAK